MQSKKIDMDEAMLNTLLGGFCKSGIVNEAIGLQVRMKKNEYEVNVLLCEKIVLELYKLNRIEEARILLNFLVKRGMILEGLISTSFIDC